MNTREHFQDLKNCQDDIREIINEWAACGREMGCGVSAMLWAVGLYCQQFPNSLQMMKSLQQTLEWYVTGKVEQK